MNYDKKKYKIWTWKSLFILHWKINPGLVVNELVPIWLICGLGWAYWVKVSMLKRGKK